MLAHWQQTLWRQFGAAIDMLENAIVACPDNLWSAPAKRPGRPEYWYIAYHTIFFLDFYLSGTDKGFAPPAPFTLSELDPSGLLPERVYSKDELLNYLDHGRNKCRAAIDALTEETAHRRCDFERPEVTVAELLLYTMRHIQHHAAQLNLILADTTDSSPRWVAKTKRPLSGE
jgi:hypothetical protein